MVKLNFRIDELLHERLVLRANAADLSLSDFVRAVLAQAAEPNRGYIFSSKDEILAMTIQILSILVVAVGRRSPDAVEQGMAEARVLLAERGLLDPDLDSSGRGLEAGR
ncbi:MAG: CopG family transcriptional regulator [Sphingobium sp.]|nr:CopG family transcriptional regulator [Sphingobium sp.]